MLDFLTHCSTCSYTGMSPEIKGLYLRCICFALLIQHPFYIIAKVFYQTKCLQGATVNFIYEWTSLQGIAIATNNMSSIFIGKGTLEAGQVNIDAYKHAYTLYINADSLSCKNRPRLVDALRICPILKQN